MHCPHCHAENADDSRFCGACGKATQGTVPSSPNLGEAPPLIGRLIAGRYRILSKLGEGGMGAVFQAEQISLKRTVAIKLLRPEVAASPLLLRRFNAEAEAVAKLRHPNTVNIYDFGQDTDGALFIAMELIEGRSLRSVVHREAPLPLPRALAIAAQVAASLADAHAKTIIHRDLKPDNVMLTDRGRSRDNVTVLDFGIAKLRDESRGTQQQMTQAGDMLGTPQYMAPEQIRGEAVDGRADVYALGCMIYEMITARLPFEATTVMALLSKHLLEHAPPPSQRRPDLAIPPAVDDLVTSAMAKDPAARPPTMEDLGERIAAVLAALPPDPGAQRSAAVVVPTAYSETPAAYSAASGPGGFAPPVGPPPGPPLGPPPVGPPLGPPPVGPPSSPTPPNVGTGPLRPHTPTSPPPPSGPGPGPGYGPPGAAGYPPSPGTSGFVAPGAPGAPGYGPPGAEGYPPAPGAPGYGPPGAYGPAGAPYPPPAPRGGGSRVMWILVAVLLLGGGGAGAYFATRGGGGKAGADAGAEPDRPDLDRPDPDRDRDRPEPPPREPDKWDRKPDAHASDDDDGADDSDDHDHDHDHGVDGTPVDVAQGVKIIAPPGMPVNRQPPAVFIGDPTTLLIVGAPIDARTNDPDALAKLWAKSSGLRLLRTEKLEVAGAQRKVYVFGGLFQGSPVIQLAVPLLGPGYRVVVGVHVPAAAVQAAPAILVTMSEILSQRIIVPSAAH